MLDKLLKKSLNVKTAKLGIKLELVKNKIFPDKKMNHSQRHFQEMGFKSVLNAFINKDKNVWTNIFFPNELLHAFDLYPLCMEVLSGVLTNLGLEQMFLEEADKLEISPTLCSYHKAYLGLANREILDDPLFICSVSNNCEGNLSGFRVIGEIAKKPFLYLEVPYEYSKEGVKYLTAQINDFIKETERLTKTKFDIDKLRDILTTANKTLTYINKVNDIRKKKLVNADHRIFLGTLLATHTLYGTNESYEFYKKLYHDLENDVYEGNNNLIRLLWLHIAPSYDIEDILSIMDNNKTSKIIFEEINCVYWDEYDIDNPIESIAIRLINNWLNGHINKRLNNIREIIDDYKINGVVHFTQWGCRQSSGSIGLIQKFCQEHNVQFISLDGDCIDSKNRSRGQLKTRTQGFIEMLYTK